MRGRNSNIVTSDQAVSRPNQFEANCTGPDHDQFLWRLGELQRFGAADDGFAVKFRERQFGRRTPVAMTMFFVSISCVSPLEDLIGNFSRRGNGAVPSKTVTLFVFISERTRR
jgi:hypothetical protein